jgi:uncharacterized membrane protein
MGLFGTVFLGPVKGVAWLAEQVQEAADQEYYDENAIRASLARLNEDYDRGRVDEESFEQREDELLERLESARARARGGN